MATGLVAGIHSAEPSPALRLSEQYLDLGSNQSKDKANLQATVGLKRKRKQYLDLTSNDYNGLVIAYDRTELKSKSFVGAKASSGGTQLKIRRKSKNKSTASLTSSSPQIRRQTNSRTLSTSSDTRPRSLGTPERMAPQAPSEFQGTHIGASVELEPLLLDLAPGRSTQTGEVYQNFSGTSFLLPNADAQQSRVPSIDDLSQLEQLVGDLGPDLIEAYVENIHFNFPIIGTEFFQLYRNGQRDLLSPVLTAAVYTAAGSWLPEPRRRTFTASSQAQSLERLAFSSLSSVLPTPDLSAIQAGLLLMQRPDTDSKTLNSQLVAAAYELGIQADCSTWAISSSERDLRKRIAWALYMQDKWCSLIHGRPSAISTSDWVVQPLTHSDFDFSFAGGDKTRAAGYALYVQMVALTETLSVVLDAFYTLRAIREIQEAGERGTRLVLDRAKPAQLKLKEWFAALPAQLKMDAAADERPTSIGYLHLCYFATEITLHRCIVRSLQSSSPDAYLTHICRGAAKTRLISAMDFANRLRPEHLGAFWYFPSRTAFALVGTFGSLLLATAPGQEEADFYRVRLREYRWTVSVSARSAPFLARAVESLDETGRLLENLPEKPKTSEAVEPGVVEGERRMWDESGELSEEEEDDGDDDDEMWDEE